MQNWQLLKEMILEDSTMIVSGKRAIKITKVCGFDYDKLTSNHDEADARLILHAANAMQAVNTVVIRSVDTNVLILAIYHYNAIVKF